MTIEPARTAPFEKWQCQNCGYDRKYVETLLDDEFAYNEDTKQYEAVGFADEFEHTGKEICVNCEKDWTGIVE